MFPFCNSPKDLLIGVKCQCHCYFFELELFYSCTSSPKWSSQTINKCRNWPKPQWHWQIFDILLNSLMLLWESKHSELDEALEVICSYFLFYPLVILQLRYQRSHRPLIFKENWFELPHPLFWESKALSKRILQIFHRLQFTHHLSSMSSLSSL